jgi:hypothetical protein
MELWLFVDLFMFARFLLRSVYIRALILLPMAVRECVRIWVMLNVELFKERIMNLVLVNAKNDIETTISCDSYERKDGFLILTNPSVGKNKKEEKPKELWISLASIHMVTIDN